MAKLCLFLSFMIFTCIGHFASAGECQATCSKGGDIVVNLMNKCLCIKEGNKCFKIDIGSAGPRMTTSGSGKMHKAEGAKFQTKSGPGTDGYDNDAIATGIGANDKVGKWIHKTRSPNGGGSTLGCIGVPWKHWKDVKKAAGMDSGGQSGKSISVCGGGAEGAGTSSPQNVDGPSSNQ